MDISTVAGLLGNNSTSSVSSLSSALKNVTSGTQTGSTSGSFESLFNSALNMLEETNALTNMAEEAELNFAMGYTDNISDLLVAQQKANISLQYTVAVRNAVMDAYKEIMQLQF